MSPRLDLVPRVVEQDRRTDLKVRTIITDHSLEDLGMQKRSVKESRESLLVKHPDRCRSRWQVRPGKMRVYRRPLKSREIKPAASSRNQINEGRGTAEYFLVESVQY